ncbi:ABC transporter ATP-binding protein [Solicola gregarius]|uniref:ATP-binding cassette domain-containing protein n=1 Tax=Solicola gregarius TaxID=2908642 RepID=A0AA46THX2_9ACTN|nr:ATP-binding cassette domain-containing protein [Solicola gregarius]UYM05450.1 ATP-binding cassette domain-containing protein [Solicola gregarius]
MLSVRQLTRRYGDITVLDDVSFDVRAGRITGFVGANGAGKTTTMRIMVGVLAPTAGEVLWDGEQATTELRRRFGYMPEERGLYPRMKVLDQLVYFARLHGYSPAAGEERAMHLLSHLGIDGRSGDLLDTLSLGNQQRVQIATALIHEPVALILDEPFSGLDPIAVESMVELLRVEVAPTVPLLFSSHQLELVERLCDDLIILSDGAVVASGSKDELRSTESERYRVVLESGDAAWLRDVAGVRVLDVDGPSALIELDGSVPADVLQALVAREKVIEFARSVQPLSELFSEVVAA